MPLSYGKALKATERKPGKIPVYGSAGIAGSHDTPLIPEAAIIVGRKGSAGAVYHSATPSFAIDTAYYCSQSMAGMDLRLAYHLLTHLNLRKLDQSTAIPSLGRDAYSDLIAPIPPTPIQAGLAARIDELFAEIEDGESALTLARDDLATCRKALLKAAVTGELTAGWRAANPPMETGADLLARILADRRTRWLAVPRNKGKCYNEPAGPDADDLGELPDGWTWGSVAQLGDVVTGGTPSSSTSENYDGNIPFFTPGDLDAGFVLTSTKRTISDLGLAAIRPIPARCILITCIGATIGKVAFNSRPGATNQQINTIVPTADDLAEFIFHYFDGPGRYLVVERASSTTMPILNKSSFSKLAVPVPPLREVHEITRVVDAHYEDSNAALAQIVESQVCVAALRKSILAAAFRGELVA